MMPPSSDRLRGVMGACLTPFRGDGMLDEQALEAQIAYLLPDVDALAVGAVEASEYHLLGDAEREHLIRRCIELVDQRVPVLAGASAPSPAGVLRWVDRIADAGADLAYVLMPTTPWGGPATSGALMRFFEEVTTRSPLPVVAYHNPANGSDPDVGTLVELSQLDGIVAFKESSRDITKLTRLIHDIDLAGHASYFTTMQPMLITLMLGGAGATMPPPGTRIAAEVRSAFAAADLDRAVAWQRIFAYFPGVWARHGLAPVMKAAMGHLGVELGTSGHPFDALPPGPNQHLRSFLEGCGIAADTPASPDVLRRLAAAA